MAPSRTLPSPVAVAAAVAGLLLLTGCGGSSAADGADGGDTLEVGVLFPGSLSDDGFMESAYLGYQRAAEKHAGGEEWVKGIRLVQDEVTGALGRAGIQAFAPVGAPFDPNEHEAMAQAPIEGHEAGTVAQVYQAGYRLNGTVLRPARVVVAQ